MRVLVLGSGAKDVAIAWWFSKSRIIEALYVAPSNPGTEDFAENIDDIDPSDCNQVLKTCKKYGIDFVFIGTEAPLVNGVIDFLNQNGINTFGAPLNSLKLESDRIFSRDFARKYNIPMPQFSVFKTTEELTDFLDCNSNKTFTIKPSAMSPSRVIINSSDRDKLLSYASNHLKTSDVILEDYIPGLPITFTLFLDNNGHLDMPVCSEYSKREHSDVNIVTGGMGSICPIPLSTNIKKLIDERIINPTVEGMKREGLMYRGVLTFSIILQNNNPYLVDFHARLNDPATQTFAVIVENDLCEIMKAASQDKISEIELKTNGKTSVGIVIASEGYPASPKTGFELKSSAPYLICGMRTDQPCVFLGAVKKQDNTILTAGGRVATVVGVADNIENANAEAYKKINTVKFEGAWYREDIGDKFFISALEENQPLLQR